MLKIINWGKEMKIKAKKQKLIETVDRLIQQNQDRIYNLEELKTEKNYSSLYSSVKEEIDKSIQYLKDSKDVLMTTKANIDLFNDEDEDAVDMLQEYFDDIDKVINKFKIAELLDIDKKRVKLLSPKTPKKIDKKTQKYIKSIQDKNALKIEIGLMEHYLPYLREIAGWTAEELGLKIGLFRQGINYLENIEKIRKNKNRGKDDDGITQAQYLALLFLFEGECLKNNNIILATILNLLFNHPEIHDRNKYLFEAEIGSFVSRAPIDQKVELLERLLKEYKIIPKEDRKGEVIGLSAPMSTKPLGLGKKTK